MGASQMEHRERAEPASKESEDEWTAAEIAEMISEDEQIACFDLGVRTKQGGPS